MKRNEPRLRAAYRAAAWPLVTAWITACGAYFLWVVANAETRNIVATTPDDAFYYYEIAANFAKGHFSTFDQINRTNGYHPLWAWLLVPVFLVEPSPAGALVYLKAFELALLMGGLLFIARALRLAHVRPWLLLVLPFAIAVRSGINVGLEGAVTFALLCAMLHASVALAEAPERTSRWVVLSIWLALLPWARLETFVSAIVLCVAGGLFAHARRESIERPWAKSAWLFAGATFSPALYFAYNRLAFGTSVPVSGQVKNWWSQDHFARNKQPLMVKIEAIVDKGPNGEMLVIAACAIALVVVSWLLPRYRRGQLWKEYAIDAVLVSCACFIVARFTYSVLFVMPALTGYPWYYAPGDFLEAVLWIVLAHRVLCALQSLSAPLRSTRLKQLSSYAFVSVAVVALAATADWRGAQRHWERWTTSRPVVKWQVRSWQAANWMNEALPESAVVGCRNAGILGYFAKQRVVNLDGLANSLDFLRARRQGKWGDWFARSQITHVADAVVHSRKDGCGFLRHWSRPHKMRARCTLVWEGQPFTSRKRLVTRIWKLTE